MKVYLVKDVPKVGIAGEVLNVSDGFAANYLIPKKLAIQITPDNQSFYESRKKTIENRKEVIATETSLLAEKIKALSLTLKKKMHVDKEGRKAMYGSIAPSEVADLLAQKGIKVAKNQVLFEKSIKEPGTYDVTIKLSSRLQPSVALTVLAE